MSKFLKIMATAVASMSAFAAVAQSNVWVQNKATYLTSSSKPDAWTLKPNTVVKESVWKSPIEQCSVKDGCTLSAVRSESKTVSNTTSYTASVGVDAAGATWKAEYKRDSTKSITTGISTGQSVKVPNATRWQYQTFVRRSQAFSDVRGYYKATGKSRDKCNADCSDYWTEYEMSWNTGIAFRQSGNRLRDSGAVTGEWVKL